MSRALIITLIATAAAGALWWNAAGRFNDTRDAVAIVGGEPITGEQYRAEYSDYLLQTGLQDELRLRHSFLNRMVDMRVLALYGRDSLQLDRDPAGRFERERARKKLLIEGYLRYNVYDTLTISDSDLEAMFIRMNTELSASHLYARTLTGARELKDRLDAGESFDALARETFADPQLADSGGSLGYFGFDEMDPRFEDAAFSMTIGEISEPVQTSTGYSIIRLDDRRVRPLLTEYEFATRRDRVRTYVVYRKRLEAREAIRESILAETTPSVEEDVLDFFVSTGFEADADPGASLSAEDLSAPAINLSAGWMSFGEVLDEARFLDERQRGAVLDRESAREVLKGLVVRRELLRRAEESGVASTAGFESAIQSANRKQLYERTWNHISTHFGVPGDSVRSYFARHADDFVIPERVRVREILVEDKAQAQSIRATLTPSNFAAAAIAYSMRPGADRSGGDLGYVTRDQMGVLADKIYAAAPGGLIGPLEVQGRYAIFLVGDRQPPRPATYEEARDAIEARLAGDMSRSEVKRKVSSVRRHYDIERFLDRVESIDLRTRVST